SPRRASLKSMSKNIVDPHGYKDWTLKTAIESQIIENLKVDIAAQTIPTLAIDIAAQSLSTLDVNIAASAATLNVSIVSSTSTLNVNLVNEVVTTGQIRPALSFDGIDDYVNFGSGPGTQVGGAGNSFSIVIMCMRKQRDVDNFVLGQGTVAKDRCLHIGYRNTNKFTFAFYGDDLNTPSPYPDVGVKVTWICTYDSPTKTQKIYRFKDLVASRTADGDYLGTGDMLVGKAPWGSYFKGDVFLVLVYKGKALTQDEVDMIVDNPYSPPTDKLTCFWRFDEGAGSIVKDHAGYDDNGTIYGATWVSEKGSASPVINVNITSQSLSMLNVNVEAQTVDLKVLTGSGARVVVGTGLMTKMISFSWSSNGEDWAKVIEISGKGRLNSIALKVYRSDATYVTRLRVVVIADGVEVLNCRLYQLDAVNGRAMSYALRTGTPSSPVWGQAPWVSKLGGIVWAQGWVADRNTINESPTCIELGALLTPDVEFSSNLQVWLYNDFVYSMLVLGGLSYGLYP
ncbi:MAG: hypothetical protein QXT14_08800, partial [Candidatus Bathyarchaeia archaeon]